MPNTLYMVVEQFKNKDAVAVYRQFRTMILRHREEHSMRTLMDWY